MKMRMGERASALALQLLDDLSDKGRVVLVSRWSMRDCGTPSFCMAATTESHTRVRFLPVLR